VDERREGLREVNFGQIKAEVTGRGFDFQTTARLGSWVNDAYLELCDMEDWPFLIATATGAAPLTVNDLGVVQGVRTATHVPLMAVDYREVAQDFTDLTVTGSPRCYYLTAGQTIAVFPVNTQSITVRYYRVPADLSADADVPVVPARFHELIVLGALRRAALEESDGPDYQSFDAEWQRGVQIMRERVMLWHRDGNSQMLQSAQHGDS